MHGELGRDICTRCTYEEETWSVEGGIPHCPSCGAMLRPKITWFGEIPYGMAAIDRAMAACSVFIVIGTSGVVYPAAGLVHTAHTLGAYTVCINKEPPVNVDLFDDYRQGTAGELVPELVAEMLSGGQLVTGHRTDPTDPTDPADPTDH
jgi:NAD-dependent deacetylase